MERYNKIFTNEQIKAIENNYSKMSLANVKSALKKIVASIKFDNFINIVNDETFLNEFDKMDLTTVCKANYLFIVIKLLKLCNVEIPEAYTKQVNIYSEARQKHNNNQRDKKVIDKTQYSLTDVYTFYKKIGLKEGDKNNNRFLVYFSILSNLPIRLTELCDMYVNKDNNVNNYIDLNKKQMIIRIHKSSRLKKNEVRIIPLNDETINDIKNYIQITKSDILFPNIAQSAVKNMYRAGLQKYLDDTKTNDKVIGIHEFRTLYEHENLKKLNNKVSAEDLKQINQNCKKMGHSLDVALTYYTASTVIENKKVDKKIVRILDHNNDMFHVLYSDGSRDLVIFKPQDIMKYIELINKYHLYIQ